MVIMESIGWRVDAVAGYAVDVELMLFQLLDPPSVSNMLDGGEMCFGACTNTCARTHTHTHSAVFRLGEAAWGSKFFLLM